MPEDAGGGEKTEQPTPRRFTQAREEGQVAQSTEVNTAVILLVGFSGLIIFGPLIHDAFSRLVRRGLELGSVGEMDPFEATRLLTLELLPTLWPVGALVLVVMLAAAISSILQVGLHFSPKALMPKPSKLSPLSGAKRLFGLRGLVRLVINLIKLTIILGVAHWMLDEEILARIAPRLDLAATYVDWVWLYARLGLTISGCLALIALLDLIYQRWQHTRDLMMTKQEVKEEMKQSEGDPMIKGRIRQIQREMARRRMLQEVPKADVVITNPTHVAVALRYDRETNAAPVVVAKGYDLIAQRIKAIAAEHNIVQVENIELARALAKQVEVGQQIPVEYFQSVAEILAAVYRLRSA